ncbi:MAG TPA: hypothetical protein VND19_08320 [Acetobacteraceae bacterium]|nr:hypothetical protein [Acetobacteraceae bacterium]
MQATEASTSGLSQGARQRIHACARRPQQMLFLHVVPAETGFGRTIWFSRNDDCPASLITPALGRPIDLPADVLVGGFDQTTSHPAASAWLTDNRHLPPPLARQEVDAGHFYDGRHKREVSWRTMASMRAALDRAADGCPVRPSQPTARREAKSIPDTRR